MKNQYTMDIEYGHLGRQTVTADCIDDAVIEAREWAQDGNYSSPGSVPVRVWSAETQFPNDAQELVAFNVDVV